MDQLITIQLFGQPFSFKSETDHEKARQVADFLVQEVAEVENQFVGVSSNIAKNAILISAALNIANKYFDLGNDMDNLVHNLSTRSDKLIKELEACLS